LLFALKDGACNATELCDLSGLSKPNLSQHINRLKNDGLVICVKQGTFCYYSLSTPELLEKLEWIQENLHLRKV
jgi:ArsR family transcriptional regulator